MIITRAPFRVSFAGGGSDLPSFYEKHGGCVLSTTIDKYVYLSVHPSFHANETILRYKQSEVVEDIEEISHEIVRACLKKGDFKGIEIHSDADIPAGKGLGSSSAFTVALLTALHSQKQEEFNKESLAQEACQIELSQLDKPIGKQDQYASAYGGLNFYRFQKDGTVTV
ncbi:MAG: GHMP kinase, partial [Streptococcaceae bacterium]|nr:GHMP kinase [Streptococcaceae bacterium]